MPFLLGAVPNQCCVELAGELERVAKRHDIGTII
jgi:hypothetical protein